MKRLLVKDLMTAHVITLDADDNLDLADMIMDTARVRHLPVVREGQFAGLVTHRDLLRASVSSVVNVDPRDESDLRKAVRTEQIMTVKVQTCGPEDSALATARNMLEQKISCMPVVDDDGKLLGIITDSDFLELAIRAMETVEARDD